MRWQRMQSNISVIFLFFSAMITENLIFARAIGIEEINSRTEDVKKIFIYSAILYAVCLPAALLSFGVKYYLLSAEVWSIVKGIVVIVAISICYIAETVALKKRHFYKKYRLTLNSVLYLSISCTSVAAVFYSLQFNSISRCIVYVTGSCVGVLLSMLLLRSGKERLELSNVAKAFQGLPITLIYIGILSMAIYGLVGHKLLA